MAQTRMLVSKLTIIARAFHRAFAGPRPRVALVPLPRLHARWPLAVPVSAAEALPESVLNPYEAPAIPVPEGENYLAQRSAKLFHGRDCSWARRIAEPERVYFKRVTEAREAGYAACPVCEPWEPGG